MAMSEDIREDDEFENGTSVEVVEDKLDDTDSSDDDSDESRTNVRSKSSGDDELENYSESVQRRINQLTAKRKQASEEAQATRAYAEASEAGDYDRAAKAQQALAQIAVAKDKVRSQKSQIERQGQQQKAQQEQQAQAPQQPQQQQAAPARDKKLDGWLDKNSWFGNDRIMTRTAQAIHETLVLEEDYDPTSDDYYKEIDSRMRREMPQKFKEKRSNAQTVAPASSGRSVKSGRKKSVELSPGQVAFAKKMRIPLDKYAREVAKIDNRRSE